MKIAPALLVLFLVGCHDVVSRTYDVTVHNQSSKTVTIWLTKNGPAYEEGWRSPEDLVMESPKMNEKIAGVFVPAGKTAFTGKVTGEFAPGVDAILRVYMGQRNLNEILAMSHGNVGRFDITLKPGANELTVTDQGSGIQISPSP
jgi:hypothetical protein